jgi:diguanylate cyclase (GGDEF)-like protein/PAS domain S-box-containing protein
MRLLLSQRFLILSLLAALGVLGAAAYVSYRTLGEQARAQAEEDRSEEVIAALGRTYALLEEAESARRGFIITGQPPHLEAIHAAAEGIGAGLVRLRALMAGDSEQAGRFEEVAPLVERRLDALRTAFERGVDDEVRIDLARQGLEQMGAIREQLRVLEGTERRRLRALGLSSTSQARVAERVLLGGGAAGLSVLLVVFVLLFHENARRRRTEERLREQEARTRAVVEGAVDAIISIDEEGIVRAFNPAAERVFGYQAPEVLGRNVSVLMPPPHNGMHDRYLRRYRETGEKRVIGLGREVEGRRRDGSVFPLELSVSETIVHDRRFFTGIARDATERKQAAEALRQANASLAAKVGELEARTGEIELLGQMGDLLQSSLEAREAYAIITRFAPQIFPGTAGAVCMVDTARRLVEAVTTWGEGPIGERVFGLEDCWALRNGRPHWVEGAVAGGVCKHTGSSPMAGYACLPMMAQGEIHGILHLRTDLPGPLDASRRKLASAFGEQVALSLANIHLRETLHRQAIHDPLTGLYNRRYLEDALDREMRRATRKGVPVGILMLDLDRFKLYNDTHGHVAGDALLRAFGAYLQGNIRVEDIACRYGGEEFAIILPDVGLEKALERAEHIREGAPGIPVMLDGRRLEAATISIGVAALPTHGTSPEAVLRAADAALYAAKAEGRNCVKAAPRT